MMTEPVPCLRFSRQTTAPAMTTAATSWTFLAGCLFVASLTGVLGGPAALAQTSSYPITYSESYPSNPTIIYSEPSYSTPSPTYSSPTYSTPTYSTPAPRLSPTSQNNATNFTSTPSYTPFSNTSSSPTTGYTTLQSRIESAEQSAFRFRQIADSSASPVEELANENAEFVEQWIDLTQLHAGLAGRVDDAKAKLQRTNDDYQDINVKLTHFGLTPTIGLLLRSRKEQLDQWQVDDSSNLFAGAELARSRGQELELELVQFDGSDPFAQAGTILADFNFSSNDSRYRNASSQVQQLLQQRAQWIASLRLGYQDYQQKIGELDSTSTAAADLTTQFRALIDRHVTWIRSGNPLALADMKRFGRGASALFDSGRSADFGVSVQRKWQSAPVTGIGLLVSIILILILRWRAKALLLGIGDRKRMRESSADTHQIVAGVLTVLIAVALPGILYAIARWLGDGFVSESTLNAATGFNAAALVALMIEMPRQCLRNSGYVHKFAGVDLPRRERAATYLKIIGLGLVLAAYVTTLVGELDHGMWRDSASRFGFIAAMLLVTWTAHLSLRPSGGFLEPLIAKYGGSVIHRSRLVIYLAGIGFPLAMIALSVLGYSFTAYELIQRAIITLVGLIVVATLWPAVKIISARVWALLTGASAPKVDSFRSDSYRTDSHRTGLNRSDRSQRAGEPDTVAAGVLTEHFLELKHQLAFLCQCALVCIGIVSIGWMWIDIFPNLEMGNPVVWNVEDTVTRSVVDAAGQTTTSTATETKPVTVVHLLLAAVTLFVAFQLAKLLPALFDALVLQRVSFDEGMEHFSLVLGRFLLFGIGCFIACQWIGIRWQTIQWLAVGLAIGLGFGLQDMVRNLYGGLIVLFEKPARLGDMISVGNARGRVSAQRLRTTVLSDDEGREVIVPNQHFIGEEVINHRGAGRLHVIPIEVAVSRDERTADLCRSLTELVLQQDEVLLTPTPQATLVCVGKRSQRIEVRAWIEEGQDAADYRDILLRVVRRHLSDKNLLARTQPSQPSMLKRRAAA